MPHANSAIWPTLIVVTLTAFLTGCSTVKMGEPQPTMSNVQAIKAANLLPSKVAQFKLADGKDPKIDQSISVRAATLEAPQGSFARYLQATLEAELRGAGLLDPSSPATIEGQLLDCQLDPAIREGRGKLSAAIVVRRNGRIEYSKELSIESTWESSFVGAIAIPAAIDQFTALFGKMVGKLIADPEFQKALAR